MPDRARLPWWVALAAGVVVAAACAGADLPRGTETSDTGTSSAGGSVSEIPAQPTRFLSTMAAGLRRNDVTMRDACDLDDRVAQRILAEYGAVFVTAATPPSRCIFTGDEDVVDFQHRVTISSRTIGGIPLTLQQPAMKALAAAVTDGDAESVAITPRGTEAAARSYGDTEEFWRSRVEAGLAHYRRLGQISDADAERIHAESGVQQVSSILALEDRGVMFNTFFSDTILHSVAPPGASQHLSLLAVDIAEHDTPAVRALLARHGWFQTVVGDRPHFTYLGHAEPDLTTLGLRRVESGGRSYWVPDS